MEQSWYIVVIEWHEPGVGASYAGRCSPENRHRSIKRSASEHKPRFGRPRVMTGELRAEILSRIASGQTLKGVCASERMPTRQTVGNHANRDLEIKAALTRARESRS